MPILVINCGSTSIKAVIIDPKTGRRQSSLRVERLETQQSEFIFNEGESQGAPGTHDEVISRLLPRLIGSDGDEIESVGHQIVHAGQWFERPTLIDNDVVRQLKQTVSLAPLHNPLGIAGIETAKRLLPGLRHVAVFGTAYHATLPPRAATYALPQALADRHGLRQFGFHGVSHEFVAKSVAEFLGDDLRNLHLITCHLGGGCSVCAIENGRSVDTSMGMTPLEGLVMATRSGTSIPRSSCT